MLIVALGSLFVACCLLFGFACWLLFVFWCVVGWFIVSCSLFHVSLFWLRIACHSFCNDVRYLSCVVWCLLLLLVCVGWLFVGRCLAFDVGCWLFGVSVCVDRCVLFVGGCLLLGVSRLLSVVWLLFVLRVVCCLLFVVRCLLFVVW